jgi:hypothetical protein
MRVPARAFREFFGVAVVNEDVVSSGDQVRRKDVASLPSPTTRIRKRGARTSDRPHVGVIPPPCFAPS